MRRYPFDYGLDVNDVETMPSMGLLSPNLAKKRDWRASAYDRVMPHGGAEMDDGDKSRMFRQGLLQLGAGLLSNGGGFGNALGKSISGGLLAMNKGEDDLADRRYKQQVIAAQMGGGTGFREFESTAAAAGLTPGTPEYKKAAGMKLGMVAREIGAAAKPQMFKGRDGKERPGHFEPNTKTWMVMNDQGGFDRADAGGFTPVFDGQPPMIAPLPSQAGADGLNADAEFNSFAEQANADAASRGEPPLTPQELNTIFRQVKTGQPINSAAPVSGQAWPQPAIPAPQPVAPPPPRASAIAPNNFINRSAEEEAAAKEVATQAVTINNLPTVGRIEAVNAGQATAAQEQARADALVANAGRVGDAEAGKAAKKVEAEADATAKGKIAADLRDRAYRAKQTVDLLNQAESLVKISTGSGAGADYDRVKSYFGKSDKGANAIAALKPIAGRLTAQMPRMEGPQSDADRLMYQQMAGDLANPMVPVSQRMAAMKQMRLLVAKYANDPTGGAAADKPASNRLKFNPATGRIE